MAGINMTFITGIRFYKDMLEQLNRMTYIYDPKWELGVYGKATFPVCFFHVKSMHEISNTEVTTKPMLFYNSSAEEQSAEDNSGLLNVVADNIVTKPKSYKLEVIIPHKNLTLLDQSFTYNVHTLETITDVVTGASNKYVSNSIASWATLNNPIIKLIKDLLHNLLIQADFSSVDNYVNSILENPDYNKKSIDAMWQSRRILKMKVWNSWTYKYVVISDLDVSKEPTEDGVYEASLTVQEVPVISLNKATKVREGFVNPQLSIRGQIVKGMLDTIGSVASGSAL